MFLFNCKLRDAFDDKVNQAIGSLENEFDIDVLFETGGPGDMGPLYAYSRLDKKLNQELIRSSAIVLLFPYFVIEECHNTTNIF